MTRLSLFALLKLVWLTACADSGVLPSAQLPDQEHACEAEREAARAEAGFRLQAAATNYAGSDEAALAQDMDDARVANGYAAAAFEQCMAGL